MIWRYNMKRALRTGAALAAILCVGLVMTGPASADTTCPSGKSCLWQDSGFVTNNLTHNRLQFEFYIPQFSEWNYSGTNIHAENSASSVHNNGNVESAFFYTGNYEGGAVFQLPRGETEGDLSNDTGWAPSGFNDDLQSGYFSSYR
jgi:hypothetical protein